MKMILMGTGTSQGVPAIGCDCAVCRSKDEKDNRLRCSAYIQEPANIVIDTGPEFRIQALKHKIKHLDAVFLTHSHADHLHGLDDLRIFSHTSSFDSKPSNPKSMETEGMGLSVYANENTITDIRNRFDYIFKTVQLAGGKPKLNFITALGQKPFYVNELLITPIDMKHGKLDTSGWLISEEKEDGRHSIAYLTDCSYICNDTLSFIKEECGILEHLVIDGLRIKAHSTHYSIEEAVNIAEQLSPKKTWITHLTHDLTHKQLCEYIQALNPTCHVEPAYDGLIIYC